MHITSREVLHSRKEDLLNLILRQGSNTNLESNADSASRPEIPQDSASSDFADAVVAAFIYDTIYGDKSN